MSPVEMWLPVPVVWLKHCRSCSNKRAVLGIVAYSWPVARTPGQILVNSVCKGFAEQPYFPLFCLIVVIATSTACMHLKHTTPPVCVYFCVHSVLPLQQEVLKVPPNVFSVHFNISCRFCLLPPVH